MNIAKIHKRHRQQARAVAEIRNRGGQVVVDENHPGDSAVAVNLHAAQVSEPELAHLTGLTQLQAVVFPFAGVGDAALAYLKGLTELQFLDLSGAKVTDAGLECLAGLT